MFQVKIRSATGFRGSSGWDSSVVVEVLSVGEGFFAERTHRSSSVIDLLPPDFLGVNSSGLELIG